MTPTKDDTRNATLMQLIGVFKAEKDIKGINDRFNDIVRECENNGKDSLLVTLELSAEKYDVESMIIGATLGTTIYMMARKIDENKVAEVTSKELGNLYG